MTSPDYRRRKESNDNTRQASHSYILPESSVTFDVKCSIPLVRDDNSVSKDRLLPREKERERKKKRERKREKERERDVSIRIQTERIINETYICSNKVSLSPLKDLS